MSDDAQAALTNMRQAIQGVIEPAVFLMTANEASTILAHVEAQAAEIEGLTAENKMLRHTHRWNVEPQADDSLLVCRNLHEKDEKCDLEHYVPAERLHDAIRERDDLRRRLAEAELDALGPTFRWRGLTRPASGESDD